jgi:hypothetical protein
MNLAAKMTRVEPSRVKRVFQASIWRPYKTKYIGANLISTAAPERRPANEAKQIEGYLAHTNTAAPRRLRVFLLAPHKSAYIHTKLTPIRYKNKYTHSDVLLQVQNPLEVLQVENLPTFLETLGQFEGAGASVRRHGGAVTGGTYPCRSGAVT